MQKVLTYTIAAVVIVYLGFQVYVMQRERSELSGQYEEVRTEQEALEADNEELRGQIEFFSEPRNLEKELRSRFNYKLPHEQLIIVVPNEDDATTTDE